MATQNNHADASHDALEEHAPITSALHDKYLRTRRWRDRFLEGEAHFSQDPPPTYNAILWKSQWEAHRSMRLTLEREMEEIAAELGYTPVEHMEHL